jgi:hypothetical protein
MAETAYPVTEMRYGGWDRFYTKGCEWAQGSCFRIHGVVDEAGIG